MDYSTAVNCAQNILFTVWITNAWGWIKILWQRLYYPDQTPTMHLCRDVLLNLVIPLVFIIFSVGLICWHKRILKVFAELWDCYSCSGVASLSQLSSAPNYYRACGKYSVELLLLSSAQSVTHWILKSQSEEGLFGLKYSVGSLKLYSNISGPWCPCLCLLYRSIVSPVASTWRHGRSRRSCPTGHCWPRAVKLRWSSPNTTRSPKDWRTSTGSTCH